MEDRPPADPEREVPPEPVAEAGVSTRALDAPRPGCVFCAIVEGEEPASVVASDARTLTFLDGRQYHPGHVLVVPRRHVPDLRAADDATAVAVMVAVARAARAVDQAFPGDGLSVWHSAGAGAAQEVPHLHFHVHPRHLGDGLLRVYPRPPACPDRARLDAHAARLRTALAGSSLPATRPDGAAE